MAEPFDTHAAVIALRNAGVDERQAEAIVNTVRDAAGADRGELATKADLAALETRMYRALWIQGGTIIGTIVAAGLAAFLTALRFLPV